jgi:hypothetical protein
MADKGETIVATRPSKLEAEAARFEFGLLLAVIGKGDWGAYYKPYKSAETGRWCWAICIGAR